MSGGIEAMAMQSHVIVKSSLTLLDRHHKDKQKMVWQLENDYYNVVL